MANLRSFNAFIRGDEPNMKRVFSIRCPVGAKVDELKGIIKAYLHPSLDNVDPRDMELYNVQIPFSDMEDRLKKLKLGDEKTLYGVDEISASDPWSSRGHIDLLVIISALPSPTPATRYPMEFSVTIKPKKNPTRWIVRRGEATLSRLQNIIHDISPEAEITDMTRITFTADDVRCAPQDDSALQQHLELLAAQNSCRITVTLETPQKAFTDYTFPMVCQLFGLSEDSDPSIDAVFPHFEYETAPLDSNSHKVAVQHLLTELNMRHNTMEINISNEATRSEYVFSFLVAAASIFKDDIIIRPQKQLKGTYGRGPLDFALESRASGGIVGVTEVKKDDFKKGIAQNAVQLESSLSYRKRKRSEMDKAAGRAFGIVTDALEWYFLECIMDDQEGLSFKIAKVPRIIEYGREGWKDTVKQVFGPLVWLLERMQMEGAENIGNKRLRC